ncbi:MAG: hypothetical protein LC775_00425 [Acidobacteria bacterium]|nr:hypothetical protein [Acidobacteriota bacterium]
MVRATLKFNSPGAIDPLSAETQPIVSPQSIGNWSWQLTPTEPGEHELSLIFTVLQKNGKDVLFENKRLPIPVTVENTFSHQASVVLLAVKDFFTTLEGILTSIAAILVILGGLFYQKRKKKNEPPVESV